MGSRSKIDDGTVQVLFIKTSDKDEKHPRSPRETNPATEDDHVGGNEEKEGGLERKKRGMRKEVVDLGGSSIASWKLSTTSRNQNFLDITKNQKRSLKERGKKKEKKGGARAYIFKIPKLLNRVLAYPQDDAHRPAKVAHAHRNC